MTKYKVIYADPPWDTIAGTPNLHAIKQPHLKLDYPTLKVEQIKSLCVQDIVEDDAVLFLWTINKYIEQAYSVARSWGFIPSTMLVWCKKPKGRGLGGTFGMSSEYLLFARRGNLKAKTRYNSTWFEAKRRKHSQKPDLVYEMIENMFDGTKIELFARSRRCGWDAWGNEIESDIDLLNQEQ